MQRQMDMFEEGGLRDEGGMVDKESGNEVPIGSTRKEVRDDIPAQVSEGEFVFPADVVRFLGLEKLMEMRQAAKMGLKQMEAMGQMGNSDEATIPDDMPFGMADLVVISGPDEDDKPQKKAQGGLLLQSGGSIRMPDFDFSNQDVRIYVKEGSPDRRIPFFDGEPVIPIPAGYVLKGSAPVKEEKEEVVNTGSDDDDPRPPPKNAFVEAGSWSGSPLEMYIKEAEKISTFGNVATGVGAAINPLIGGFMALAMRDQKKKILASIDKRIEEASKTDVKGQVKALKAVKDRLTTKEGQGIVSKVIESFIKPITDGLGITNPKAVEVVKNVSNKGANDDPNDDKGDKVVVDEIVKSAFPSGRLPIDTPPSVEDQTDEAIPLDQIYSEKERSYQFEDYGPKYKLGNLDQKDRLNETVLNLQAADALDKSDINIVDPVVKAEEVTGGLGPVKSRRTSYTRFEDLKNKYAKFSAFPSGRLSVDTPPKTFDDSLVYDITDNINSLVSPRIGYESGQDAIQQSPDYITGKDGSGRNTAPTPVYTPSTPDPVVTPTSSSDDDDDNRPSLAERMQRDSGKGRDTGIKVKTDDVTIKNRTDSSGKKAGDTGYKSALRERQEAKKSLEAAGFEAGTYSGGRAKGGLATRRK